MEYKVYNMINVAEANSYINIEAFICFNTEEDRSFNALFKLSEKVEVTNALILSFVSANTSKKAKEFQTRGIKINKFEIEEDLNCDFIPCLKAINNYVNGKYSIGIDISCMPIPFLAQILHFILEFHKDKLIKVYYTEPYHYTLRSLFDYSAYNGEIDPKVIKGFEGETSNSGDIKRILFYLMGFEKEYLNRLIAQEVPPDEITPINGFPAYFPKYKDITLINDGTDFYVNDVEVVFTEANNPFDVYNTIASLRNKYQNYRVDIIPAGTKPMALGACLYALKNGNTKCRIIFPFPKEYRPKQNHGCGKLWEYSL